MLVSNLVILGASVATVSARSIGSYISHIHLHLPFAASPTSSSACASTPTIVADTPYPATQCIFAPHQPLQKTQNPASIPLHAWPHIHSLLASYHPSSPSKSSVQTLHLDAATGDESLESVVLGIVYTAPETSKQIELRAPIGGDQRSVQEECLESALEDVETGRRMEGVFEMKQLGGGRGKLGFLVYRVD